MLTLERPLKITPATCKQANLAEEFSKVDLKRIGAAVVDGYTQDENSRIEWRKINRAGMDLAMQVSEEKTFPWPNCSNVAFPLVTIAALQFHARAYPQIVSGSDVVRCQATGFEPTPEEIAQAERVGKYMSYQLLEEDRGWEEGQDRLLLNYAIVGCAFKKTYYSPLLSRNTSLLVTAEDLVLDYFATSVDDCRRKTHVYPLYRNAIIEGIRATNPIYCDVENEPWFAQGGMPAEKEPRRDGTTPPARASSAPFVILEQHVWLDLDADGYEEPYIVTVERESQYVLRIVARWEIPEQVRRNARGEIVSITAMEYFTKYGFIPSPDGSIYDLGFGRLLGPLNESVNTAINMLNDSGTMSTAAGGFLGRGAKIRSGVYTFSPFEWKRVDSTGDDLSKSIFPLPVREPSAVLFNLLGLLIDYTNRISGATETMVGENPGQNTPAETSRSMVEQGMKVYAAIFKRAWRCMKEEFRKFYILNGFYAPQRYRHLFHGDPGRVCPAADPNIVSDGERFQRAATIAQRAATVPGYNPATVEENFLRSLKVDDWKKFYPGVDPNAPPPKDVRVQVAEINAQTKMLALQASQQEFVATLLEDRRINQAEIIKLEAEATLALARAAGEQDNLEIVKIQMALAAAKQRDDRIRGQVDHFLKAMELASDPKRQSLSPSDVPGMVAASGDSSPQPLLGSPETGTPGPMGQG